jgi:pseudaminic acid biosynthesis-associated methylase
MGRKMTKQMEKWKGEFGKEYTDRNEMTIEEHDQNVFNRLGVTRTKICEEFLSDLNVNNILEVGTNIGMQLVILHNIGKRNLYGIELQDYAINKSKEITKGKEIYIIKGSALDIPFKSNFFNLVFTSGLLIHISPKYLPKVMDEIYRCSNKYIWGHEYYSNKYEEVEYRGSKELLWKGNFSNRILDRFSDLELVKEIKYPNKDNPKNVDVVYLLKKKDGK